MVYSYSTNSLVADIVDLTSDQGPGKSLEIIWSCYIGGPAGPTAYYDVQRFKAGIDQAFAQSPYINRNTNQ
jgi:hypothetical protein